MKFIDYSRGCVQAVIENYAVLYVGSSLHAGQWPPLVYLEW